jgi:hypothetical protein
MSTAVGFIEGKVSSAPRRRRRRRRRRRGFLRSIYGDIRIGGVVSGE